MHTGNNLLWLKLRPDTPQHYEYITVEDIEGHDIQNFLNVNPWTQFFDLKGRTDKPVSKADHICMRNCVCDCGTYFNVKKEDSQYLLSDFVFENLHIRAKVNGFLEEAIQNVQVNNVVVEELHDAGKKSHRDMALFYGIRRQEYVYSQYCQGDSMLRRIRSF